MRKFSEQSQKRLQTCDERLVKIFDEVIKIMDCTVVTGHRGEAEQNEAFRTGKSKLRFPLSKHNSYPSKAVDVVPWPVDWTDYKRFFHFAGIVRAVAYRMNIRIRWGGDWDSDFDFKDEKFIDLPHFELVD